MDEEILRVRNPEVIENIIYDKEKEVMEKTVIDSIPFEEGSVEITPNSTHKEDMRKRLLVDPSTVDIRNLSGLKNITDLTPVSANSESLGGINTTPTSVLGIPIVITGLVVFLKRQNGKYIKEGKEKNYGFTSILMKCQFVLEESYVEMQKSGKQLKLYTFMTGSKQLIADLIKIKPGDLPVRCIIRESFYKDNAGIKKSYFSFSNI